MTPVELLLSKLGGVRKSGSGWSACCPAHEDRRASLSISAGSDGTALVNCHAGCSTQTVLRAIGLELRDLFPTIGGTKSNRNGKPTASGRTFAKAADAVAELERWHGKRSGLWTYYDAQSEPVGVVVRWDRPTGKDIRPVSRHTDGWRIEHMPKPRPLYGLPELAKATSTERIWVLEGEKAVDAVRPLGLIGTTSSGGANAAKQSDWSSLRGQHVVILPDNDQAGRKYAHEVAELCQQAGVASVRILDLAKHAAELPVGGDLADIVASVDWCGLPLGDGAMPADLAELLNRLADAVEPWQSGNVDVCQNNAESSDDAKPKQNEMKKPSMAEILTEIGCSYKLWHDESGTGYAMIGRASVSIRANAFRSLLTQKFYDRTGKVPNAEALGNAINAIEAQARYRGVQGKPCVRVAHCSQATYLHLADDKNTVIEIDADGWRLCEDPPVRFIRHASMEPLPMPERSGHLDDLRKLLNCPEDNAWVLLKAWMTAALTGRGPFPLLVLVGEQGTAKSTTARMLKALLDPCKAMLRSEPREVRDLMIAAVRQQVLVFDNVSNLPAWLSDALCRLATGGGFATRTLYTDDDETTFDAMRPVILNGISDFVTRHDLLERSILLHHPPIADEQRRTEAELWERFQTIQGRLLGAMLDRIAGIWRVREQVKLNRLPRMADFAMLAVAAEQGAGEPARFLSAYGEARESAELGNLESNPLASALLRWLPSVRKWEGSAAELLGTLNDVATDAEKRSKGWPTSPRSLVEHLKRIAPSLRQLGGQYERAGVSGRAEKRRATHSLTWVDPISGGNNPIHPIHPIHNPQTST